MNSFGDRIKELRKDMKLTQDEFGKRIGIKKSSLSSVENGTSGISDGVFINIVNEFSVNEAWLKDGIGEKYNDQLKKHKEFIDNEIQFMSEKLAEQKNLFYEKMKENDEDIQVEMITALEEIYSLLNGPKNMSDEDYFCYYETISGMLLEINRFISYLLSNDTNQETNTKYFMAIQDDLKSLCDLLDCNYIESEISIQKDPIIKEDIYKADDLNTIGVRIKYIQEHVPLTNEELQTITGLNEKQINAILSDLVDPPLDLLIKLSDYTKISIDWFIKGSTHLISQNMGSGKTRASLLDVLHSLVGTNKTNEGSDTQERELSEFERHAKSKLKVMEVDEIEEILILVYRMLSLEDKKYMMTTANHLSSKTEYSKKKQASSISGHGEEAACIDQKMRA